MCDKDLPARNDLCKRDSFVVLPLLSSGYVIDENDEVVSLAVVDDLSNVIVSARHFDDVYGELV